MRGWKSSGSKDSRGRTPRSGSNSSRSSNSTYKRYRKHKGDGKSGYSSNHSSTRNGGSDKKHRFDRKDLLKRAQDKSCLICGSTSHRFRDCPNGNSREHKTNSSYNAYGKNKYKSSSKPEKVKFGSMRPDYDEEPDIYSTEGEIDEFLNYIKEHEGRDIAPPHSDLDVDIHQ